MSQYWLAATVALVLIVLLVWYVAKQTSAKPRIEYLDTAGFAARVPEVDKLQQQTKPAKSFMDMTDGEKVGFIINTYFKAVSDEDPGDSKKKKKEDAYVNSLPVSSTCGNDFDDCKLWAQNGECNINPEFMLYSCPGACGACALTPQQKHNVTVIYNNRAPAGTVSHGQNYPGNFPYLNRMYSYNVHYT